MIIKTKCYFLKKNVNIESLKKYGFHSYTQGASYVRGLTGYQYGDITCYRDTGRFVYRYPRTGKARIVVNYIDDLIKDGLVEIKVFYSWLSILGRWQNYSQKKINKIEEKLGKLNGLNKEEQ